MSTCESAGSAQQAFEHGQAVKVPSTGSPTIGCNTPSKSREEDGAHGGSRKHPLTCEGDGILHHDTPDRGYQFWLCQLAEGSMSANAATSCKPPPAADSSPRAAVPPCAGRRARAGRHHRRAGIRVGHATETRRPTGCTVVIADEGGGRRGRARLGAGHARDRPAAPTNPVERQRAVPCCRRQRLRARGSHRRGPVARGTQDGLQRRRGGRGADRAGGDPVRPQCRRRQASAPMRRWAIAPARRPGECAGAGQRRRVGTGATVGKLWGMGRAMKGGIGTARSRWAASPLGDRRGQRGGRRGRRVERPPVRRARSEDGRRRRTPRARCSRATCRRSKAGTATTIGAGLRMRCPRRRSARSSRRSRTTAGAQHVPVHTMWDGDSLFALATGRLETCGQHDADGHPRRRGDGARGEECRDWPACRLPGHLIDASVDTARTNGANRRHAAG